MFAIDDANEERVRLEQVEQARADLREESVNAGRQRSLTPQPRLEGHVHDISWDAAIYRELTIYRGTRGLISRTYAWRVACSRP